MRNEQQITGEMDLREIGWSPESARLLWQNRNDSRIRFYFGLRATRKPSTAKTSIPQRLRKEVFERDAYRCRKCGDWHDLSVDHVIPEARGGPTIAENLQTLCMPCNLAKGAR